jgi:hypothetical protein
MEYGKIISVTGLGGLYELVGSKKDGAIVRSLEDKSTKFVASRIHNFSHLESIEVYTSRDNANLAEVFTAMQNSSEPLPSEKDAKAVKSYFEKVFPEMDFERVYSSDMKKMVKWYNVLKANDVEIKLSHVDDEESEPGETEDKETEVEVIGAEEPEAEEVPADVIEHPVPPTKE